jgi:formamidopyrimidine-DNA glycosylase
MPELPEVQTTVNGLKRLVGEKISDIWSSYNSKYYKGKKTIKDPKYFEYFKKQIMGAKITGAERRAKYILIELNNNRTIICHMKMTGHFLLGKYIRHASGWEAAETGPLRDPFNRHIRLLISFASGKQLAFADTRRFGNMFLTEGRISDAKKIKEFEKIGPEPLDKNFTFDEFKKVLYKKSHWRIKPTLMNQEIIAGIGNIYADEILWRASIHPEEITVKIKPEKLKLIFNAMKETLAHGISLGGDSMSDYRNIDGEKGKFQETHKAYRKTGDRCSKSGCKGKIIRKVIATRSAHFCDSHQKLSK